MPFFWNIGEYLRISLEILIFLLIIILGAENMIFTALSVFLRRNYSQTVEILFIKILLF